MADRGKRKGLRLVAGSNNQAEHKRQLDQAVSNYDDTFLDCRTLGHSWRTVGMFKQGPAYIRRAVCTRCTMERDDVWMASGVRISNRYRPPADYRLPGDIDRSHLRREVINRVTVYNNAEEMVDALFNRGKGGKRA